MIKHLYKIYIADGWSDQKNMVIQNEPVKSMLPYLLNLSTVINTVRKKLKCLSKFSFKKI